MTTYEPLSIGEIFDRAVTIVVTRWRPLLFVSSVIAIAGTGISVAARSGNPVLVLLVTLPFSFVTTLFSNALVAICGEPEAAANTRLAVRIGLRRFWPVFGLYFLFGLLAGLAAVLLALPILIVASAHVGWLLAIIAIVYILAGLPVSAYLIGFIAIAYVYVVLENMGPFTALNTVPRRGKTAGGWRLLLLGAAIMALSYVPALVVGALPDAIAWLFAVKLAGLALMNVTIFVYATAVETVAAIDYRNRSTGADLAQLLEARARA